MKFAITLALAATFANAAPDAVPEECWSMVEFMDPYSNCGPFLAAW